MKRIFTVALTLLSLMIVTACTVENEAGSSQNTGEGPPEIVEVDINLPEKMAPNEESILKAVVTQGDEPVGDADEVQFEIWKANQKQDSNLIDAKYDKDGVYQVKTSFDSEGVYYVQTHVTARDLHVMPKMHFVVGDVSEEEVKAILEKPQQSENGTDQGHHH
ncbi:FixH family protein [Pseudalkalibacillus decolorationis]|uniref:FixH family protein n=1 Tax=Pseudalkalibacillus decolorationis TaxID=163879 RepID=UPI002148C075|nr:FixH family protein [Pseudalkalibacillus decolorationis]